MFEDAKTYSRYDTKKYVSFLDMYAHTYVYTYI